MSSMLAPMEADTSPITSSLVTGVLVNVMICNDRD